MPQLPTHSSDAASANCGSEVSGEWPFAAELGELQSELQAYSAAVSGDPSSAADIVQEANMVIWEKRDDFHQEKEGDFRAWAFRIAYFKALAHRRDSARKGWLVYSDELVQKISNQADGAVKGQNRRMDALQQCLTKLKPKQRKMLAGIYGAGQTVPEYAASSKSSHAAAYKTLQRIRLQLRDCINHATHPSS